MDYSIIIPVYNCKAFLSACVEGVHKTGISSYEILLINDGSTDGSGALCDALGEKYPQVRVIHQSNGGASAARNRGLREAQGRKLLFLDADDCVDSAALGAILKDPRSDETDLTIFGLTFDYYSNAKRYRRDPMYFDYDGFLTREDWCRRFVELYENNSLSPIWNKVFKREFLLQCQLELNEDMFLYEDFEFVLRYLRHCGSIWNVPKAVYHYRQTEDEGNAKRRLSRVESISVFLRPIETALTNLKQSNPALSEEQVAAVLQQLYLVLAREKISVSDLEGIRRICREFILWAESHALPGEASVFQTRLLEEKAVTLLLADKITALRHRIAVWAKAHNLYKR